MTKVVFLANAVIRRGFVPALFLQLPFSFFLFFSSRAINAPHVVYLEATLSFSPSLSLPRLVVAATLCASSTRPRSGQGETLEQCSFGFVLYKNLSLVVFSGDDRNLRRLRRLLAWMPAAPRIVW